MHGGNVNYIKNTQKTLYRRRIPVSIHWGEEEEEKNDMQVK